MRFILLFVVVMVFLPLVNLSEVFMSDEIRLGLRDKVKKMFFHGYTNYMVNAFPADELMPLSCKGRYRGVEPSRGDVDDSLGNFSLTLVDSLDTLVILDEFLEFESAVRLVLDNVRFDSDLYVSVFETNIRMIGGLLGGHVGALIFKQKGKMSWYKDELLQKAVELGDRLLPAFNTTTGIPYPRINLKTGDIGHGTDTCTACAGTMVLEFAALSRFSGNPVYEIKAKKAMDSLWRQRNLYSNLMGTVINVHNGDWTRKESGIGAGIDSYYEYLFKAYVLLGEDVFLHRFSKHYKAVSSYMELSKTPLMADVLMHQPNTRVRNFMDALLAFWPGLQVMTGDLKPAVELHEILYQIVQRHNFIPEAFTSDYHVHWAQHPLRPEFIESTYFLYSATKDHYYLQVGKEVVDNLEKFSRVECGYAAISDIRDMTKSDQLDSFVLAETFKYLYLLFADPADIPIDIHSYIFTTEAHILPLELANLGIKSDQKNNTGQTTFKAKPVNATCPNYPRKMLHGSAYIWRKPLRNMVNTYCPKQKAPPVYDYLLKPEDLNVADSGHRELLQKMGINMSPAADGQMQLFHNAEHAISPEYAEKGLQFMHGMIALAQQSKQIVTHPPNYLFIPIPDMKNHTDNILATFQYEVGPAQFGPNLVKEKKTYRAFLIQADPLDACVPIRRLPKVFANLPLHWIVLVRRGGCLFIQKIRNVEAAGGTAVIVVDNASRSSSRKNPVFAMSADGGPDVGIPSVFAFYAEASSLLEIMRMFRGLAPVVISGSKISNQLLNSYLSKPHDFEASQTDVDKVESSVQSYMTYVCRVEVRPEHVYTPSHIDFVGIWMSWEPSGLVLFVINMDYEMTQTYHNLISQQANVTDFLHSLLVNYTNVVEFPDELNMTLLVKMIMETGEFGLGHMEKVHLPLLYKMAVNFRFNTLSPYSAPQTAYHHRLLSARYSLRAESWLPPPPEVKVL